jgi:hypothetical protein
MSVPFCSVHTIRVSVADQRLRTCRGFCAPYLAVSGSHHPWICASRVADATGRLRTGPQSSLLLPVVAQVSRAQCDNCKPRWHRAMAGRISRGGWRETYTHDNAPAEAGAPVEPVIVLELVDFDALAIVGRWRYQCHNRSEGLHALRPGPTRPPECSARSRCLAQCGWAIGGRDGMGDGCSGRVRAGG